MISCQFNSRQTLYAPLAAAVVFASHTTVVRADEGKAPPAPVMTMLAEELAYSMENLVSADGTKPYYLAYTVYEEKTGRVDATLGAILESEEGFDRNLNIDLRVGDYKVDNTHQIRGGGGGRYQGGGSVALSREDNVESIRQALWYNTDREFKSAHRRFENIKTNLKIKVEEEDQSDDFTREDASVYHEVPVGLVFDRPSWEGRLRKISAIAREFPLVYTSRVGISVYAGNRYMATTEGTRLQTAQTRYRLTMEAGTKADDGMDLSQFFDFNTAAPEGLPDDATIEAAFRKVIKQVLALREAPVVEPYTGPAILLNRASGVFFHEIFGHRIEGHRQKDVTEGQTFTKKIGQPVLPEFISVVDDPSAAKLGAIDLRGYYKFDDEGVKSAPVNLVEAGVLKTFLLSRSPVAGFTKSNAHGRRSPGNACVSRQGNLRVHSAKQVPFTRLRELLIEECKAQAKPYGLLFEDISGGFTTTSRAGPQSFKVLPIVVYKVYADDRPDELVRGVDIVGTPLSCFEKIIYTGDDPGVFNGTCGAESGWVPVSAISPSILVSSIEIEKRQRDQSRPPILAPPLGVEK